MTEAAVSEARGGAPLAGLRVLDLSRLLPGAFATRVLFDLGADVDKVEDPHGGDYLRLMPPQVDGMNAVFHALNHGKRSVVLDLKRPRATEALLRLVKKADVLVESFRPGVMDRLGLSRDLLASTNPRLIHCAITGYGQDGPLRDRAGHDLDYLARAGVLSLFGPEDGPPHVPGVQLADMGGGGLYPVVGILAALAGRARTGRGAFVDSAMCEGAIGFGVFGIIAQLAGLSTIAGSGPLSGGVAPYHAYRTKDGGAVALGALEPKFWTTFCTAVGIAPSMEALVPGAHQRDWKARLAAIFAEKTRDEWTAFSQLHDCCLEPVLSPAEAIVDPHLVARRAFVDVPLPSGGSIRAPRTPVAARDIVARTPAPKQGEHTKEVLREAGLTDEEIAALA